MAIRDQVDRLECTVCTFERGLFYMRESGSVAVMTKVAEVQGCFLVLVTLYNMNS